jgi:hypothetical protein
MLTGRSLSRPRDAAELYLAVSATEQQARQFSRLLIPTDPLQEKEN